MTAFLAPLDDAPPVMPEAFGVRCHTLAQDLAQGAGKRGRFEHIHGDAEKIGTCAGRPERVCARHVRVENRGNPLHVADPKIRILRYVGKRIPASGIAILGERMKQIAALTGALAVACGEGPVLELHVQTEDRALPKEQIRDDDRRALLRTRRRGQEHTLLAT